jgi:phosphohistidine phosphatase
MLAVNVFFLRHGEAGKRVSIPSKDMERSLTEAGKEEIEKIARSLERMNLEFDNVATSPLSRALETAEIVVRTQKKSGKVELWDELRPEGNKLDLFRKLSRMRQDTDVLLVGHEPYLSNVIGEIISGNLACRIVIKKGGLARVQITSFSPKPSGELRWLLTPRQLKKM